jgi:hypothetical protein
MNIRNILFVLLITEITIIILLEIRKELKKVSRDRTRETDLRLTYKRYMELYPNSTISYPEYKKLQTRSAYKKAVSSMKIERMVR